MSYKPAQIINHPAGRLEVGAPADIAIIEVDTPYVIDSSTFVSKGKNTPFNGMEVYGDVEVTLVDGKIVYQK